METLRIERVTDRASSRRFATLPHGLYADDPYWVAPLRAAERDRWRPARNPTLRHVRAERWLGFRGRRAVGRIAAFHDPRFGRWAPDAGFIGFFDCADDPEAAAALLAAAETRLRGWSLTRALGPVNVSTNDEVGLLVDGFDRRPAVLTPYGPPYLPGLLEGCGYTGSRDYGAWEWTPEARQAPALRRLFRMAERSASVRAFNAAAFEEDVRLLHRLYGACFADLWGFVPMRWDEFRAQAELFRPFYRPELIAIAERDGAPVGFSVILPDVNEALAGLGGRLLPFGWLRLLRGMRRLETARFLLMGVLPSARGSGVAPLMAERLRPRLIEAGIRRMEVSLVQTTNRPMVRVVEALGCVRTRTVRLYEKSLERDRDEARASPRDPVNMGGTRASSRTSITRRDDLSPIQLGVPRRDPGQADLADGLAELQRGE